MPALSQSLIFHTNSGTNTVLVNYNGTGTVQTFVSDRVKGDGYFGGSDGFHTVMYTATPAFVGTVTMQATLASEPVESDWFNLVGTTSTYSLLNVRTTSTVDVYNFTGNFVWVRSQIAIGDGSVSNIRYNH
jgi:hypothetical protein